MKSYITPARFRFFVQLAFTLFCIYVGFRFAAFLAWAMGRSSEFVAKPGAVEGFLPISALLGLRQLVTLGEWDVVHPAGLAILLAVLLMALVFRKGFCGYICPVGFISNLLERAGCAMGLAIVPRRWIDYPLMSIKYGLLGFFLYAVVLSMNSRSVAAFISGPYNMVADARMLAFFTSPSALSLAVIGGLIALSLVVRNAWCRYLCPYGALLGLLGWLSPVAISRDETSCVECGKCSRLCPSGIDVQHKATVRSPECVGCAECIGQCPVDGCLGFSVAGRFRLPWLAVGVGCVVVLLLVWAGARATGHWDADIPVFMYRKIYPMLLGGA